MYLKRISKQKRMFPPEDFEVFGIMWEEPNIGEIHQDTRLYLEICVESECAPSISDSQKINTTKNIF